MNFKIGILLVSLSFFGTAVVAQNVNIKLYNSLDIERKDELIVLKREFLEKKFNKKIDGKLALTQGKQPIYAQFDDLNGDGIWDEIAFLRNFNGKEKVSIQLSLETDQSAQIKPILRAYVRQKRKSTDNTFGLNLDKDSVPANQQNTDFKVSKLPAMLTEGPAWENDKVGFRFYMDIRNQKDIWGKRTSQMVLDHVGTSSGNNYHRLSDWGMDILIVGKSLAAGALAVNVPLSGKDTLVRLGGKNMGKIIYEKVANGPVRAIFRMHYPEWNILGDGKLASLTEEISIWGGQFFYQSKVTLNGGPAKTQLVTGMVNLSAKTSHQHFNKKIAALYSYDVQTDNKDKLGLAVSLPKNQWVKFSSVGNEGVDIKNSCTAFAKFKNNEATFRFHAGWELTDNKFKTAEGFTDYVKHSSKVQATPIKIK